MKKVIMTIAITILTLLIMVDKSVELKNNITNNDMKQAETPEEEIVEIKEEPVESITSEPSSPTSDIDGDVINYVDSLASKVNLSTSAKELTLDAKLKIKEIFITLTDFIFYDGTIKGITFNELSATAKQKVLDIYVKIDQKIESVWPNYKDTIKTTSKNVYTNIKEEVEKLKEKILEKYKDVIGEEKYDEANQILKEDRERLKESASSGKNYVKKSYETIKEKANGWYQNIKESSE